MMDLDNVSLITLVSIAAGSFGLFIRTIFRSKCSDCDIFWGLVKVHREVDLEAPDLVEPALNKV